MTNHYVDASGNTSYVDGTWTSSSGLDGDYHTYGLLWQAGLLVWYVDGVERYRTTSGVPDKPALLNSCLVLVIYLDWRPWQHNFPAIHVD
jgi:beta-glucanase (GH16 family)